MDERAANWSDGRKPNMFYIGLFNRELGPVSGDNQKVLCQQARLVVIFKHEFQGENIFSPVVGEADTGAQFSFITVALAEDCDMNYVSYQRCTVNRYRHRRRGKKLFTVTGNFENFTGKNSVNSWEL